MSNDEPLPSTFPINNAFAAILNSLIRFCRKNPLDLCTPQALALPQGV